MVESIGDFRPERTMDQCGAEREPLPPASEEPADLAAFIEQGRKRQAARLSGGAFADWLLALAKLAEPEDPAAWLVDAVVLNEECWFDYFADGDTPASCWAEECSYD